MSDTKMVEIIGQQSASRRYGYVQLKVVCPASAAGATIKWVNSQLVSNCPEPSGTDQTEMLKQLIPLLNAMARNSNNAPRHAQGGANVTNASITGVVAEQPVLKTVKRKKDGQATQVCEVKIEAEDQKLYKVDVWAPKANAASELSEGDKVQASGLLDRSRTPPEIKSATITVLEASADKPGEDAPPTNDDDNIPF